MEHDCKMMNAMTPTLGKNEELVSFHMQKEIFMSVKNGVRAMPPVTLIIQKTKNGKPVKDHKVVLAANFCPLCGENFNRKKK